MVPELLSEQIEAADVLVLNKVDIAGEEQVSIASKLVKAMNKKASVFEVTFGDITVRDVIGAPSINTDSDDCTDPECTDSSHSHSHEHADNSCDEPSCDDPTHDHSHSHEHADATCTEPSCDDPTHDHSHSHDHDGATCTDPTHDHSHSHDHDGATCTDPTHDHSHSHDHSTSMDALGISNFVYKSDRPFNAIRLMAVLHTWPVPVKDCLDLDLLAEASKEGFELDGNTQRSPFVGILRSKGFCWMAPTMWHGAASDAWRHNTAMFWSHAGKHFGVTTAGKWWGTIKKEQMKGLFTKNMKEYERIIEEDFVSEEFGDRRQEIVFIGANINATEITEALDECLCTDEEMEAYREDLAEFQKPATTARARPNRTFQAVGPPEDEG
jgi:G3E family GTPase